LFTREKIINVGVYSIGSQTRGFFLHGISALPPYLGQDYEQNGFGEKRGMVKLNRLSGHKMGKSYGVRVRKTEISRGFQKEGESAGVKRTTTSRRFGKQRKDCGTSSESFGMFDCEGLSEFNLCSAVSCCVAISSCVAILYCVGISSCGDISSESYVGISSCVDRSASRFTLTSRNTYAW
jgi:hypothetical protein